MKKITTTIALLLIFLFSYSQEAKYSIRNLPTNTKYSDFGVAKYGKDEVVYSSTRKDMSPYRGRWRGNHQPYLSMYKGSLSANGDIVGVELFSEDLTTKYHEATAYFTKDLQTVYFSSNNYLHGKYKTDVNRVNLIQLYRAKVASNGDWTEVESLPFNSDNYQTGHPALNASEDKLYFISDMPGSLGLTDVYVVDIHSDGSFGEPKNLGATLNTPHKEMFPHIGKDGFLYFSSEGHADNKGGLDLYKIALDEKGLPVGDVINMGYPLNSPLDDFALIFVDESQTKGYFSSNRRGGKGDDDIYYFEQKECVQLITGTAIDKNSQKILPNTRVVLTDAEGKEIGVRITNDLGVFEFSEAPCTSHYQLEGNKTGYDTALATVETTSLDKQTQQQDLYLLPKKFKEERGLVMINLEPIYFDLDKSFIRPDAEIELRKVLKIYEEYPDIELILGSHTDSRAPDAYNMRLSQRRYNSTKAWLVARGVNPSSLTGGGYGETQLVNHCSNGVPCSEAEHQLNRRTEFIVKNPEIIKKN